MILTCIITIRNEHTNTHLYVNNINFWHVSTTSRYRNNIDTRYIIVFVVKIAISNLFFDIFESKIQLKGTGIYREWESTFKNIWVFTLRRIFKCSRSYVNINAGSIILDIYIMCKFQKSDYLCLGLNKSKFCFFKEYVYLFICRNVQS